jgi:ATP-binding cassette subfamily C protein LapB
MGRIQDIPEVDLLPSVFLGQPPENSLLDCLLLLSTLFHKPASKETLTAGLPDSGDGMSPKLFIRAAARIGLSAKLVRRSLDEISPLVLPAVLLLNDRRACLLVGKNPDGSMQIVLPETGGGERAISFEELAPLYSGNALFTRPAMRFESRTADSLQPRARHWFWSVVAQSWPIYGEVLVASLFINLFALVIPLFTMNVYDRVVPNRALETLWGLAIGAIIVVVFDLLIRSLRGYFIDMAGKKIDIVLSAAIFERVLGIRFAARPASVGAFASSLQDFEAFREFLTSITITALVDLPFVFVFLIAIYWVGGPLVWVSLIAFPMIALAAFFLHGPLSEIVQANCRLAAQRQATLIETLVGLECIKVTNAEGQAQRKWEQAIGDMARLAMKSRFLSAMAVNLSVFAQQVASIAVLVYGVYLIGEERLTMGSLIACSILTGRALAPLSQVAALITRFHQSRLALNSIDRLMHLPIERPPDKEFVQRGKLRGAIEFSHVSFSYPGTEVLALDDVSFRIAPGERVAFIGRVGSGKTTIEKLILGLYVQSAGAILIDGIDSRQIDPAALRSDIGYVPQDITLFYGSVRDNIVLGAPYADDKAVLRAAQIAGVTEFVNRSPYGFDLPIGERGEGISGGQRQAIAIARAELLAPPLLLLDEPSSSLDNRSEEQLKIRLDAALAERTLILISHRASLLTLVNRLIVIDQGRVLADGPKEKVLAALAEGKINVASA